MEGDVSTSLIMATILLFAGWIALFRFLRHRKSRELDRKFGRRAVTFKIFLYLVMVAFTIIFMRVFIYE